VTTKRVWAYRAEHREGVKQMRGCFLIPKLELKKNNHGRPAGFDDIDYYGIGWTYVTAAR